jgi:hypothetical protein
MDNPLIKQQEEYNKIADLVNLITEQSRSQRIEESVGY